MILSQLSRRVGIAALVVIGFVGAGLTPADAGSSKAVVFTAPLDFTQAQGDIKDCVGETLTVTGGEYRYVLAGNVFHANVFGGLAVGDTTEATYKITGHMQEVAQSTSAGVYTLVVTLNAIGQGGAGKFTSHILSHFTVTPDGVPTAEVDSFEIHCG